MIGNEHNNGNFGFMTPEEIMLEFEKNDAELASELIRLRRVPSHNLQAYINSIPNLQVSELEHATSHQIVSVGGGNAMVNTRKSSTVARRYLLNKVAYAAFALALAFAVLFAAVPSARAEFMQALQRFGFGFISPSAQETENTPFLSEVQEAESLNQSVLVEKKIPSVLLEEAQQSVPFPIPVPTRLSQGIHLSNIRVGSGASSDVNVPPVSVVLVFSPDNNSGYSNDAGMNLQITQGSQSISYVIPMGKSENVTVNGWQAIYVKGAWDYSDKTNLSSQDLEELWQADVDAVQLSWEDDKFTYVLSASGLGLGRDQLIEIAESVMVGK